MDIGANIGLYALQLAKLVGPTGTLVAFEPGRNSYEILKKNIEVNRYKNIRLEKVAVLDRSGETDFFLCPTGESDNRAPGAIDPGHGWDKISVPCVAIDDYLKGRPVDFVKIDIQGSELPALLGMRRTIENCPGIKVLMEYTPDLIDSDGFFRFIGECGLSINDTDGRNLSERTLRDRRGAHINIVLAR